MKISMRIALLGSSALMLAGALGNAAQAQVQMPGWFGAIDGQRVFSAQTGGTQEFNNPPVYKSLNPGHGYGIAGQMGYRFMSPWDIAVGGRYVNLNGGKGEPFDSTTSGGKITGATLWTVDGDIGYTFEGPGYGVRPFVGVRYQHWRSKFTDIDPPIFNSTITSWGVGPRAGVDGSFVLSGPISIFAGVDGAVLFGKIKDSKNGNWLNAGDTNGHDSRTFWSVGGKIGLDWEVAPMVHIAAGYKGEYFNGITFEHLSPDDGVVTGPGDGRSAQLVHGPFVRVAYNLGVPRGMPVATPAPQVPMTTDAFIIFFDFDRSVLTDQAKATVKQAADAFKAKGKARITATGHADKSGPDAYNMALSLRRANVTKDELIRDGVPAAAIVVVGRGESQPLVPTADGVREPQNRRVEIVLQ